MEHSVVRHKRGFFQYDPHPSGAVTGSIILSAVSGYRILTEAPLDSHDAATK